MEVRTRFAPSPTGYMHLGNLRTALYTYLYARRNGGKFILRIEDTDQVREVEGAVDIIYNSLRTAGLIHDEGPDVGGPVAPYVQSERKDTYMPYAKQLVESGHAYYCFCTKERLEEARAEAEAKGESFKYDKHCLHLSKEEVQARLDAGEPFVIRQNIPTEGKAGFDDVIYGHVEVDCDTLDDNVLIKADGLPTYNFANVIDDHLMGITHVMRGNEYLSSAPKYNLLYEAFGWTPPAYVHLTPVMVEGTYKSKKTGEYQMQVDEDGNLVLDENGNPIKAIVKRKMSKSQGDPSFEDLLAEGYLVEAVINYLVLLGWSPRGEREFFSLKELEEAFDLEGLSKSPSFFDMQKLNWFNAEYVRKLSPEKYLEIAAPWMAKALDPEKFDFKRLAELLQARTEVFSQLPGMIDFLAEMPEFDNSFYVNKKQKSTVETAKTALEALIPILEGIENWTEQELHDKVLEAIPGLGMKNGQMLWPMRIAISGKMNTPGGAFEIAYLLGREETMKRLKDSIAALAG
ncbi:MAG: glutamate--tRNA ligase [Clostridiales bacterium]|nr:glutamate--tRNA ligase [Clostridiales bacterium]